MRLLGAPAARRLAVPGDALGDVGDEDRSEEGGVDGAAQGERDPEHERLGKPVEQRAEEHRPRRAGVGLHVESLPILAISRPTALREPASGPAST
jgi:hypothetical protein